MQGELDAAEGYNGCGLADREYSDLTWFSLDNNSVCFQYIGCHDTILPSFFFKIHSYYVKKQLEIHATAAWGFNLI